MPTATEHPSPTKRRITLAELEAINIGRGSHDGRENGLCIMETVAWLAGEPHSDSPECVSPIIARFLRTWNDRLPDDETRNRLLKPLAPKLPGTAVGPAAEDRRAWMIFDWLIREFLPPWLKLAKLDDAASAVEAIAEIHDFASLEAAMRVVLVAKEKAAAAWDAAMDAAGDAAWDAAMDAAWAAAWAAARAAARAAAMDAAWDAAWDAAMDAARAAAWAAAGAAAGDAAWDAAMDAAWAAAWAAARAAARAAAWAAAWAAARAAAGAAAGDAAWDAAKKSLAQTVAEIQVSAVRLIERLVEVK